MKACTSSAAGLVLAVCCLQLCAAQALSLHIDLATDFEPQVREFCRAQCATQSACGLLLRRTQQRIGGRRGPTVVTVSVGMSLQVHYAHVFVDTGEQYITIPAGCSSHEAVTRFCVQFLCVRRTPGWSYGWLVAQCANSLHACNPAAQDSA